MPAKIPNVNERRRIPMRAIRAVAKQIADTFHPDKIILFGSYAYGKPRPESDVDLLVIMDTPLRNREQAAQIARAIDSVDHKSAGLTFGGSMTDITP